MRPPPCGTAARCRLCRRHRAYSTATRSPARRSHSAGRPIETAAAIRLASIAVASRSSCSAQYGIKLPRSVKEQFRVGKSVKPAEVAPGDLLFFSTTEAGASHVGIAVGGDEFIHAPSSKGVVRVERLSQSVLVAAVRRRPPGRLIYAARNAPLRTRRRDVSFKNCRTCRSSSE